MSEVKAEMGFAEFARHLGVRPSYITELRKAGRLVLTDDAKAVKVAESLALIDSTRDPSRGGVAARHAAARGHEVGPDPSADSAADPADDEERAVSVAAASNDHGFQKAKAINERYKAMTAKVEYERLIGRLAPVDEIEAAAADLVTSLRRRLENMGAMLAPLVAPVTEPSACRALIDEYVEGVLRETSDTLKQKKGTPQ
jgi:hypothetical protein